jgi:hypothetical protein
LRLILTYFVRAEAHRWPFVLTMSMKYSHRSPGTFGIVRVNKPRRQTEPRDAIAGSVLRLFSAWLNFVCMISLGGWHGSQVI